VIAPRTIGTALLLALGGALTAQNAPATPTPTPQAPSTTLRPQPPAGSSATLHQAWLAEVLDLDTKRATALLTEVAQRSGPGNLDRWVAAARLAELRRIGVPDVAPIDLAEAPREIRDAAAAQPALDVKALTERVSAEPEVLYQSLGTEAGRLPPLRQIVPAAEMWLLDLIDPNLGDRSRQRREFANRAGMADRINANLILDSELAGRRAEADGKRALYFAGWQPPAVSADPKVNLERFRTNLTELLRERQLRGYGSRERLGRLRSAVEVLAATDPAAAVALLLRLPTYTERLLKETPTQGR
jgi:hypothetical protein